MRHLSTLLILLCVNISLTAQSVGVNLPDGTTANTMLDVNGGVSFREGTALTCANGVNSNIALTNYSFYRVTGPTAAFSITGFGNGTDGRVLTIVNASGQTMTLSHLTTSTTANQINTGGSAVVLPVNGVATMIYNANLTKWIVSGTMGSSSSFTAINNGTFTDSTIVINNGVLFKVRPVDYIETYAWGLDGNAGTVDGTNFLGTTNNVPLSIRVNNQKAGRIDHLQSNAFWGYQAGNVVTTGSYNTAIGQLALAALTQGVANLGVGTSALAALTTGSDNTAVGSSTLATMTTGHSNVAIGNQSGLSNTTGVRNVSIGYQSARNGTHSNSVMIGYQAGLQNAASNNVFIGSLSGPLTSTGADNIGMGYYTLFNNQTGKNNIGIGSFALSTTTAAWGNTAVGHLSGASIQTGQANTSIGDSALLNNVLGNFNTALGYRSGEWTTGSNNITIGFNAAVPVTTASNQLAIGNWLYGTGGLLGINTIAPQYKLDIDANTGSTGNPLRLQGLQAGLTSDSIVSSNGGLLRRLSIAQVVSGAWSTTGNSGTTTATNFIGTTDNQGLSIRTNNSSALTVPVNGYGGLINFTNKRTSAVYSSSTGLFNYNGYLSGNVDTSFSILGSMGLNDLYMIYGKVPTNTGATDGELHFLTGDDGNEPFIFEQYNQTGSVITERMRIHSNGNIGIGASAPVNKLDVEGAAVIGATYSGTNTAPTNGLLVEGNIGLGLTSPSVKLHQDNGTATATHHKFTANATTGQTSTDGFDVGIDATGNAYLDQNENLPIIFNTNGTERMRISGTGDVLVGALAPAESTSVAVVNQSASDLKDDVTITTYNSTTTPAFVIFKARGTAAAPTALTNNELIGGFNANGYLGSAFAGLTAITTVTASDFTTSFGADIAFKTTRSGTSNERMRIMSTGNVGIGTTTPAQKLSVVGNAGLSTGTAWTNTSDRRVKENIESYKYGLNTILAINPVYYTYTANSGLGYGEKNIGVIAQDLEKVLPEAIMTAPITLKDSTIIQDGKHLYRADAIWFAMINAFKEQQVQIEATKAENSNLKAEIEKLKTELTQHSKITEGVLARLEKLEAALNTKPVQESSVKAGKR